MAAAEDTPVSIQANQVQKQIIITLSISPPQDVDEAKNFAKVFIDKKKKKEFCKE